MGLANVCFGEDVPIGPPSSDDIELFPNVSNVLDNSDRYVD